MHRTFVAALNGEAILAGDLMFSTWHNRPFIASRSSVDGVDGDVYLAVPGGNANLKHCAKFNLNAPTYFDAKCKAQDWEKETN